MFFCWIKKHVKSCYVILCRTMQGRKTCARKRKTCIRKSSIQPSPSQKFLIVKGLVLAIMVPLHLPKHVFVPPQLVHLHGFCMYGIKLYDNWTIGGTNQCLHKKLASNFVIIFHFQLLFNKFNVRRHPIKFSIRNLWILPCPPCQLGPFKVGTMSRLMMAPKWPLVLVLGSSLPFPLSQPPTKAIMFYFWQKF